MKISHKQSVLFVWTFDIWTLDFMLDDIIISYDMILLVLEKLFNLMSFFTSSKNKLFYKILNLKKIIKILRKSKKPKKLPILGILRLVFRYFVDKQLA